MRISSTAVILFFLLAGTALRAEHIAGTVTDKATGEPLGYVRVQAVYGADTLEDMTDLKGNFTISIPGSSSIKDPGMDSRLFYGSNQAGIVFSANGRILHRTETGIIGRASGIYLRLDPETGEVQKSVAIPGYIFAGTRTYRTRAKSAAPGTFAVLCSKGGYITAGITAGWGDTVLAVSLQQMAVAPAPTLKPGSGFADTVVPGPEAVPVGDSMARGYNAAAIAQWDVVPEQAFTGQFGIGVVAFHIYGIDYVEFSVEGGVPETVRTMTLNPRTGVEEYWVNLDASDFTDGWIEVRAKAYPVNGKPYQLEPLELYADQGGTANFPVLELDAGTYVAQDLKSRVTVPYRGWQTIRPKPGVKPEECILTGGSRFWKGHIKVEGVTWLPGAGGDMLYGSSQGVNWAWLHNVTIIGNGRENTTWWTTHHWAWGFFTGCDISRLQNVFHGTAGQLLVRNVHIHDIYEDTFRVFGLATNVTIEGVDRGATEYHPALFSLGLEWKQSNLIFYNVTAVSGVKSMGFAGSNIELMAVVNVAIRTIGFTSMYMGGPLNNILFQNSDIIGGGGFMEKVQTTTVEDVVLRDSRQGWREPYLPDYWQTPGITVWRDGNLVE